MGKNLETKQREVAELKHQLSNTQMMLVIDYKGLTVAEITDLRRKLRPTGTTCTVAKNTLLKIAARDHAKWKPIDELAKQASAYLFVREDISGAIKAYQEFQKVSKKTELRGGVMDGRALTPEDVKAIADLPSKEQLMAQVAGAINSITAKIAIGVKEVPNSLARAIKAISEKEAA